MQLFNLFIVLIVALVSYSAVNAVQFTSAVHAQNVTPMNYDGNKASYTATIQQAVANVLGISSSEVSNVLFTKWHPNNLAGVAASNHIDSYLQFTVDHYTTDPTVTPATMSATMQSAVIGSNTFRNQIRSAASSNGATVLQTVNMDTTFYTSQPFTKRSTSVIPTGAAIAMIVIGAFLFFALIAVWVSFGLATKQEAK